MDEKYDVKTVSEEDIFSIRKITQEFIYSTYDIAKNEILLSTDFNSMDAQLRTWQSMIYTDDLLKVISENKDYYHWLNELLIINKDNSVIPKINQVIIAPDNNIFEIDGKLAIPVQFRLYYDFNGDQDSIKFKDELLSENILYPEGKVYILLYVEECDDKYIIVGWQEYRPSVSSISSVVTNENGITKASSCANEPYLEHKREYLNIEDIPIDVYDSLLITAQELVTNTYSMDYSNNELKSIDIPTFELNDYLTMNNYYQNLYDNIEYYEMSMKVKHVSSNPIKQIVKLTDDSSEVIYEIVLVWDITEYHSNVDRATFLYDTQLEDFAIEAVCDDPDLSGLINQRNQETIVAMKKVDNEWKICYWITWMP